VAGYRRYATETHHPRRRCLCDRCASARCGHDQAAAYGRAERRRRPEAGARGSPAPPPPWRLRGWPPRPEQRGSLDGRGVGLRRGHRPQHRSAAELWALLPAAKGDVHVTLAGRGGRNKRPGIHLHRSPSLTTTATTRHKCIAVTTPDRTLTDLRRTIDPALYRKAVREAEFRSLALGAAPTDHTRSELERAFLRLCRRRRLPLPEVNVRVGSFTVDFLWREERLIVETDGYAAHRGRQAFEDDHARELALHADGYRLRRFTDRQVRRQPDAVAAVVARALNSDRAPENARARNV
jgi:very-short-patch-repair endonuclease